MGGGAHGGHTTWGNMAHFRGVVMHHLSPFEQRTFAGWFSHGFPNILKRIRGQVFVIGIPMTAGLMVYDWANKYNEKLSRKDPAFFEEEYQQFLASQKKKE